MADEKQYQRQSFGSENTATNIEDGRPRKKSFTDVDMEKLSSVFENPLSGLSREQLFSDVDKFCTENGLADHIEDFRKGALVAQSRKEYKTMNDLNNEEKNILEREQTHRWSQPFML